MGGLHAGHASLVTRAGTAADRVITTLFVNPTQFAQGEDLSAYPRTEQADAALVAGLGCDLLFAPPRDEVYPEGFATRVLVSGLTDCLCGAARPGHFDGVTQVVAKLLNQTQADAAIFGEKDWQQLTVVRRMARDLDIPTRIVAAPTVRDPDGLALSSRNRYLGTAERAAAAALPRAMRAAIAAIAGGTAVAAACSTVRDALETAGFGPVDYVEVRDGTTLAPASDPPAPGARIFVAARLGAARLIDNMALDAAA